MENPPPPARLLTPHPHPHPHSLSLSRPGAVAPSGVPVERRPRMMAGTVADLPRAARGHGSFLAGGLPLAALALAPIALAPGCGPSPAPAPPVLDSLEVAGRDGPKPLVPAFAPGIHHYAVRCAERETLTVTARPAVGNAAGETEQITLNGAPLPEGRAEVALRHDQDLAVAVRRGAASTTYAIHCVPLDFPEVTVVTPRAPDEKQGKRAEGLLLLDPRYDTPEGERVSYLAVLDDRGVPRFHRRIEPRGRNFRWHPALRLYSYARFLDSAESCGRTEAEVVLLDERFEVADRVRAAGLCNTDWHDFLITDEGNYLFLSFIPAERDFSAVPDEDGDYPWSTTEATHDSVIQEVTPSGEVVFQWNSGEARGDGAGPPLKFADCRRQHFPEHYAWLNSFSLTGEGNLLASFRGCAQVLEIERPSGRIRRQIGGSAPAIADGRVHHRFVGDPVPVGFCGQHTPVETGRGANGDLRLAVFDNAVHCPPGPDPNLARPPPPRTHRPRVVEYRLSGDEAVFLRHYEIPFPAPIAGSVEALPGGNWLISPGWDYPGGERPPSHPTTVVEVDPTGREVLALRFGSDEQVRIYRAYRETSLTIPLNLP